MKVSIFLEHLIEMASQRGCPPAAALREAQRAGVGYVEIDFARARGREAELSRVLEAAGLKAGGLYGFFDCPHRDETENLAAFLDCGQRLGAATIMAMPGQMQKGDDRETAKERIRAALTLLGEKAAAAGVPLVLEDFGMPDSTYGTAEELLWYLNRVPNLGCTFDTGNFLYHGKDVLKAYDQLYPFIRHVHMKDLAFSPLRGEEGELAETGKRLYPAPVGSGELPLAEIVRRLYERRYDGIYAIEHFGAKDQTLFMRRSARWLNNIL